MNTMVLMRVRICVALMVGLAAPFAGTAGQSSNAAAKPTVLKVSSWAPPGHLIREGLGAWCDELSTRSRGALTCDLAPTADTEISQTPGSVVQGNADIAIAVHSLDPESFVLTRLAELPLQTGSAEQVSVAYYKTWQKHLGKRNEHGNARVLTVFTQTAGDLYTVIEPVAQLPHLKGLKLSAGGGTAGQVLKQFGTLGARDASVPLPAAVHAITDHQLDGLLSTAGNVIRYGLINAIGHQWQVPGGLYRHSYALLMNPAAWANLTPAGKKALADMSGETAARIFGRAADRLEQSQRERLLTAGLIVRRATSKQANALKKQLGLISQAWLTDARNRGLANAAEVLRDFRRELERQRKS